MDSRPQDDYSGRLLNLTQTSLAALNLAQPSSTPPYFQETLGAVPSNGSTRTPSTARTASSSHTRSRLSNSSRNTSIGTSPTEIILPGYSAEMEFGDLVGLPCPFSIVGCKVGFRSDQFELWHTHSLSHFGKHRPPKHALCVFCDTSFDDDDPHACWNRRMMHTAGHHRVGEQYEKPDFSLLRYMSEKKLLRDEDYEFAKTFTERPDLPGLIRSSDDLPKERYRRETDGIQHDLGKERRQLKGKASKYRKERVQDSRHSVCA